MSKVKKTRQRVSGTRKAQAIKPAKRVTGNSIEYVSKEEGYKHGYATICKKCRHRFEERVLEAHPHPCKEFYWKEAKHHTPKLHVSGLDCDNFSAKEDADASSN